MPKTSSKGIRVSILAVYASGLKKWFTKQRWLRENSVLIALIVTMALCLFALALHHEYSSKLGDLGQALSREVIMAFLTANTVGLFYEFFARKSMADEILRVVKLQLRKDDKLVDRLTTSILEYQRISESGLIEIGTSRGFFHKDVVKSLKSASRVRVLALHGARLWVNEDLRSCILSGSTSLRVLLLHPDSDYVASRVNEFAEEYDQKAIRAQIISAIRLLQKWRERKPDACQIKLYESAPSFWLVFVDDLLYLSNYSRNRNSQDAEVYKIRNQKHSIFHMFDEHFERLWSRGEEIESLEELRA